MGASMAYALRGFREARLLGADTDELVCRRAEFAGAVHKATQDAGEVMAQADLLLFCVYAHHIPPLLSAHAAKLKPGALLGDICGVKTHLYQAMEPLLPGHVDYVGVHPMAGKERDGFDNADPLLYRNSGFIITPLPRSSTESISAMKEMAGYIGATRVSVVSPEEHDRIIAYTSDLMHIASAGLCMDFHPGMNVAFTAGAFRDCTRVADINAAAWTELLLDNRANTVERLDRYLASLQKVREALCQADTYALNCLLRQAGENKREMLQR
jgi:prephenate dehydrogenase